MGRRRAGGRTAFTIISSLVCLGIALVGQGRAAADPPSPKADAPAYRIEYKFEPGSIYYYVIENEFVDSGAIMHPQFPLGYSSSIRDKRTIVQTVVPAPATQPAPRSGAPTATSGPAADGPGCVHWMVDRYEARERAFMKKECAFDSLRDSYPVSDLAALGHVPGSRIDFCMDRATGAASQVRVSPATNQRPMPPRPGSGSDKTATHCAVNAENVREMLFAFGPLYFPDGPKRVGDSWVLTHREPRETFGTVVTKLTCTLKDVSAEGIATIDFSGVLTLEPPAPKPPPATQPAVVIPPVAATRPVGRPPARTAGARSITRPPPIGAKNAPPAPVKPAVKPTAPAHKTSTAPSLENYVGDTFDREADGEQTSNQRRPGATTQPARPAVRTITPASRPTTPTTTRPVPGAASQPTSAPAKPGAGANNRQYTLERGVYSGQVKFDLRRGELIELIVRHEVGFVAEMTSDKGDSAKVKQGTNHTLRVHGSRTAPPKPIIPGGPKPPVEPEPETPGPGLNPLTTRPATSGIAPTTSRPGIPTAGHTTPANGAATTRPTVNVQPSSVPPKTPRPATRPPTTRPSQTPSRTP